MTALPFLLAWVGSTLLVSGLPRLHRERLDVRILPYVSGGASLRQPFSDVRSGVDAIAMNVGERVARLAGIVEPTHRRLERAHLDVSPSDFRTRQITRAVLVGSLTAVTAPAIGVPTHFATLMALGAFALVALMTEQQLITAGRDHQDRITQELPVIEEQLAMLLGAGWSLGTAIGRLAERSSGATSRDLGRVTRRVRQGLDHRSALQEWADLIDLPAVHRLVRLLALERHGGDLSRLVSEEARSTRLELHRLTIEDLEKRAQLVWVPVTVATLLPGVVFLAIPFLEAMRLFRA